jgi:hypothetical protein
MLLKDLPETYDKPMKVGSSVYLVRKISNHVTEMILEEIGERYVEVRFNLQNRYKLDLEKNEVIALDATIKHRQEMKLMWTIWLPQRETLLKMCKSQKTDTKKRRKTFGK